MPLTFNSISHGKVPFGFFNIETDMLLLDSYVFFSTHFCKLLEEIYLSEQFNLISFTVYKFKSKNDMGNLHGAISGEILDGFIGGVYRLYPFPDDLNFFKQAADGYKNQAIISSLVDKYAAKIEVSVTITSSEVSIGEYWFSLPVLDEMLEYLLAGGYPGWKNEIVPQYILKLSSFQSD